MPKIIFAADHAGFALKEKLKEYLTKTEIKFEDLSPTMTDGDDYPDHAFKAAKKVVKDKAWGVFVCGSGNGMCMCANKVKGIRAALCTDINMARRSRQDEDANVLCLGAKVISEADSLKILKTWINNNFMEGRHRRRIDKIAAFESS